MIKFFLLLIFFNSMLVQAQNKVIWLSSSSRIMDNFYSDKNTSLGIELTRILLKELNDEDIQFKTLSFKKIDEYMANSSENTYCVAGRIKNNQRQKTELFSQTHYLYPNLKLYYHRDNSPIPKNFINDDGELISLTAFFNSNNKATLTIENNRSYDEFIDQQINLISTNNLNILKKNFYNSAIVAMLIRKEINYTLIFPTAFHKNMINFENYIDQISSISIHKNPTYIHSRVACSRTELGRKTIEKINQVLNKMYLDNSFYLKHIQFLNKKDHPKLKKYLAYLIESYTH